MHHEGNHLVRVLMAGLIAVALFATSQGAWSTPNKKPKDFYGDCSTQLPTDVTVSGKIEQTGFATNYFFCITDGKSTPPASVYTSELSFHFSTQNGEHCYTLGAGSANAVIAYMIKDCSGYYKGSVDMANAVVITTGDAAQPEPTPAVVEEGPAATEQMESTDTLCADGSVPDAFGVCAATVDFDAAVMDDTSAAGGDQIPCAGPKALIDPSCLVEVADVDEDGIADDEDACPEDFDITNTCAAGVNNPTTSTSTDPKKTTSATNPFDGGGGCALQATLEHSNGMYLVLSCIALLCAYGFTRSHVRPEGDDKGDRS